MATYKQIQNQVREVNLFVPKTCWLADVMSAHGLTHRSAPNRLNLKTRTNPCPADKKAAIKAALMYFQMV
jgi:hypothetical protein